MKTTTNNLKIRVTCELNYTGLSTVEYRNSIIYFSHSKYYEKQDVTVIIDSVLQLIKLKNSKVNNITIDLIESDANYDEEIIDSFRLINSFGKLIYDRLNLTTHQYNFEDDKTIDSVKLFLNKYLKLINDTAFMIYIDSNINKQ